MKTYFIDVLLHHYVDFSGRATRKQFWLFVLWCFIVAFLLGLIFGLFGIGASIGLLLSLLLVIPQVAIFVRRVKDSGHSAYWGLLTVPSVVATIVKVLPENLVQSLSSVLGLIAGFSLLCFIGILIFALLPSKK